MFTLVIGGAASGKSEYAEAHVETLPGRRLYIATMEPWDEECRARIARHQAARAHKRFTTVECYRNLSQLTVPPDSNVLLECLGNLVANERYGRQGGGVAQAVAGVAHLLRQCRHVTVVTNEVFSSGEAYQGDTLSYLRDLAWANRTLARRADRVVELVCGMPCVWKGTEGCGESWKPWRWHFPCFPRFPCPRFPGKNGICGMRCVPSLWWEG